MYNKTYYIIDTNILMGLESYDKLIAECEGELTIPVFVLEELDKLKTYEGDKGFKARRAARNIEKVKDFINFYVPGSNNTSYFWNLPSAWEQDKMDNKIINCAAVIGEKNNKVIVVSNDLNVRLKCESVNIESRTYLEVVEITQGWIEENLTDVQYDSFLRHQKNLFNVPFGQYLILKDEKGERVRNVFKYCGETYWEKIEPTNIGNYHLGTISAKDAYQECAIDSLLKDDFTVITGKAGSGKTLLSLTYALREIESGARRKLIIFANPTKTRGSEQLGYYPGDRTEKLMQNSVGAMLTSKFGDIEAVTRLMDDGQLDILPFSDIRGYEVGEKDIMYISEAQNLNIDLAKLAIQRCATGSKIILEGDPNAQVDHYSFEGLNNGMRRAIEVFEGYENEKFSFSHVSLPNIYRSEMANKAEEM